MTSNFQHLSENWAGLFKSARQAEENVYTAPRTSVFYSRYSLEAALAWIFQNDGTLRQPYELTLAAMMHEPTFKERLLPTDLFAPINAIRKLGNQAVHPGYRIDPQQAILLLKHLHLFLAWFTKLYSSYAPFVPAFNPELIPRQGPAEKSAAQLQALEKELETRDEAARKQLEELQQTREELEKYRAELEVLKAKNESQATAQTQKLDHSESETRELFIDLMLTEAGWDPHGANVREYPVTGMAPDNSNGKVDYVLWGDDGLPLAVVEAKRTMKDARAGEHQAELYADALEKMTGQRPVIFYSNGYETYIWDDQFYAPRLIQGFLTKDELQLAVNRRQTRKSPGQISINNAIVERPYQHEAIRRVTAALDRKQRRCLLAMSMGTGKTRTAVALTELLMKAGWVRRVLFLADRRTLVKQAYGAFKEHLPSASLVNLLDEREDANSRVVISTYQTLINILDERDDQGRARFGPGYFDLVWIDEVHRSVYRKYGALFDYFDSLLIGLTATPRDELSKNTYRFMQLEEGQPTFAYGLDEGVADGFLCPPRVVGVPLKFPREGIKYADLSDEDKEEYEEKFFDVETGTWPEQIESSALGSWLFNEDTVDHVLDFLMKHGKRVAGGERLGKTIIFAKNQKHAEFIRDRFNENYPEHEGRMLRVVHHGVERVEQLIDEEFSQRKNFPDIAASVDMLDTGFDLPEALNLVFFKEIRSKVKFWQMIGRGTRLCKDLFGPGEDKKEFYIFDFCSNFEFFDMKPDGVEAPIQDSISQKVFRKRLQLALKLQEGPLRDNAELRKFRTGILDELHADVSILEPTSFQVKPHLKHVLPYKERARWEEMGPVEVAENDQHIRPLIQKPGADEFATRFDLLIHDLQLETLAGNSTATRRLHGKLTKLAEDLARKSNIPAVQQRKEALQRIRQDSFPDAASVGDLENIRHELRDLIHLIDRRSMRPTIYTDLDDEVGESYPIEWQPGSSAGLENYRRRVEKLIRGLADNDLSIRKLKLNQPLTEKDLQHLEDILFSQQGGVGTKEDYEKEAGPEPLGIFIRRIIGLDQKAAQEAFSEFLSSANWSEDQIAFVNRIILYLSQNGVIEPEVLFEAPFTDLHSEGLTGLFEKKQTEAILSVLESIRKNAAA